LSMTMVRTPASSRVRKHAALLFVIIRSLPSS
jgi:hypothetical protein